MPGRDCVLGKPDRQAPTLAQGHVVFGPIRHPAPLFGDMVAASSIGLEWHRGSRVTEGGILLRQPSPDANRPIRATNSFRVSKPVQGRMGRRIVISADWYHLKLGPNAAASPLLRASNYVHG